MKTTKWDAFLGRQSRDFLAAFGAAEKPQTKPTLLFFCPLVDVPKVAFAVSLGGNGLQKTTSGSKTLIYKDVLTNIGQAYSSETGRRFTCTHLRCSRSDVWFVFACKRSAFQRTTQNKRP